MIEVQKHRLMILGSMDEFVELVNVAKSRGIYTIVCDGYLDGPAKAFADLSLDIDVRDIDRIAKACRELGVDGIVTSFSDLLAECLVKIADRAGLPCYSTPEAFEVLRDKRLMKRMFAELGIPTPKCVELGASFGERDLRDLSFPCVMKPVNGYGSRGVHVAASSADLRRLYADTVSYSSSERILVESYNTGFEFNMMTWILDGAPVVLSIADREKSQEVPYAVPHVSRIVYPSKLLDNVLPDAREIARKVAGYVGIDTGPLSVQFFYTPERGIEVCEVAGRLFGYEHELIEYASGFSIENLLLDYVYDHRSMRNRLADHDPHHPRCSAGLYFHGHEKVIGDVSAAQSLSEKPGVNEVLVYYRGGDRVGHGVGARPYVARVYLEADSRHRIDELTKELYGEMSITGEDGENLLYSNQMIDYGLF